MSFTKSQESNIKKRETYSRAKHWTVKHIEVRSLTREDLMSEKIILQKEIDEIALQLGKAKARVWEAKEYSDPMWFQAASHAKRLKGRQMQEIQLRLSELNQNERKIYSDGLTKDDWDGFHKVLRYLQKANSRNI